MSRAFSARLPVLWVLGLKPQAMMGCAFGAGLWANAKLERRKRDGLIPEHWRSSTITALSSCKAHRAEGLPHHRLAFSNPRPDYLQSAQHLMVSSLLLDRADNPLSHRHLHCIAHRAAHELLSQG